MEAFWVEDQDHDSEVAVGSAYSFGDTKEVMQVSDWAKLRSAADPNCIHSKVHLGIHQITLLRPLLRAITYA